MTLEEIEALVRRAEQANLAEVEFTEGGATLRLRVAQAPPVSPKTQDEFIAAPAAGWFLAAHPLRAGRFLDQGATLRNGEIIGFLQVGPCLRPVCAMRDAILGPQLVPDGTVVGYGTPLYALR